MSKVVLVVEDEVILRNAYEFILKTKGYEVLSAENGQAALTTIAKRAPDLILLDLLMPVMDGKRFLQQADLPKKFPNTKVIVYSNVSDHETVQEVLGMGVEKHILKSSMSPNNLVEQVERMLSG